MLCATGTPNATSATFEDAIVNFPTTMRKEPVTSYQSVDGATARLYSNGFGNTPIRTASGSTIMKMVQVTNSGTFISGAVYCDAEF